MVNNENGFTVCGEAGTAQEALQAISRLQPDLALVDISLPGGNGLDLVKKLRARYPRIKLLVVSMHDEALYADRVLRAGGDGYIMKQEAPDEILDAIHDVAAGHIYVSEAVLGKSTRGKRPTKPTPLDQLSDTEIAVLELVGRGKSMAEIARQIHVSIRAVSDCRAQLRKKLGLKSPHELLRYAICWVETGAVGENR